MVVRIFDRPNVVALTEAQPLDPNLFFNSSIEFLHPIALSPPLVMFYSSACMVTQLARLNSRLHECKFTIW